MKEKKIDIHVLFTEQELAQVHQKMEEIGVTSRSAYLRKMALDGYCINLDLKPVKEMLWFCEHKETQHKHTKNARKTHACVFVVINLPSIIEKKQSDTPFFHKTLIYMYFYCILYSKSFSLKRYAF